jgi:hypothetical protein
LPRFQQTLAAIAELANTLRGNLDKIIQHGKRADSIVKNMLLHSREGSGEGRPKQPHAIAMKDGSAFGIGGCGKMEGPEWMRPLPAEPMRMWQSRRGSTSRKNDDSSILEPIKRSAA